MIAPTRRHHARGFSIVEASISILLTGVTLAAAFAVLASIGRARAIGTDRVRGGLLAQDLLAEILIQAYEQPGGGRGTFGLESSESDSGDRALFNDVDDYHEWTASPPQIKDGTPIAGLTNWARSVQIVWVTSAGVGSVSDTRIKKITVTVTHNGRKIGEAIALRSAGWDAMHGIGEAQ